MKKLYQITKEGKAELEEELKGLKDQRGHIADKIAEARDYGDLSENAEYDSAREQQGIVESRIAEIEDILLNAEIIKATTSSKVKVGSKVELKAKGAKKNVTYFVVGPVEADPMNGKISNESPIGVVLMGASKGDKVTVPTPKGGIEYEVVSVG